MFRKKITIFIFLFFLGLSLIWINDKVVAGSDYFFYISLNWQNFLQNLLEKILPAKEKDVYKEKYYQLLEEFAKLKLMLDQIKESSLVVNREKYLPNLVELDVLKVDAFGNVYVNFDKNLSENSIFLDKNWSLVGKIDKITKNYAVIKSLNSAGLEFNVSNLNRELLGLGRTLSNGFVEVNFVDPKIEIKENDFVLTYGDEIFPAGFLVGTVEKIIKNENQKKIIVKTTFDLKDKKIYLIK